MNDHFHRLLDHRWMGEENLTVEKKFFTVVKPILVEGPYFGWDGCKKIFIFIIESEGVISRMHMRKVSCALKVNLLYERIGMRCSSGFVEGEGFGGNIGWYMGEERNIGPFIIWFLFCRSFMWIIWRRLIFGSCVFTFAWFDLFRWEIGRR